MYFQPEKIYFQHVKIYFQAVKLYFQGRKNKMKEHSNHSWPWFDWFVDQILLICWSDSAHNHLRFSSVAAKDFPNSSEDFFRRQRRLSSFTGPTWSSHRWSTSLVAILLLSEKALADVGRLFFAIESQIDKTNHFLKISGYFLVYSKIYCYICSEI